MYVLMQHDRREGPAPLHPYNNSRHNNNLTQSQILSPQTPKKSTISFRYGPSGGQTTINPTLSDQTSIRKAVEETRRKVLRTEHDLSNGYSRHRSATRERFSNESNKREKSLNRAFVSPIASVEVKNTQLINKQTSSPQRYYNLADRNNNKVYNSQQYCNNNNKNKNIYPYRSNHNIPDVVPKLSLNHKNPLTITSSLFTDNKEGKSSHIVVNDLIKCSDSTKPMPKERIRRAKSVSKYNYNGDKTNLDARVSNTSTETSSNNSEIAKQTLEQRKLLREIEKAQEISQSTHESSDYYGKTLSDYNDDATDYDIVDDFEAGSSSYLNSSPVAYKASISIKKPSGTHQNYTKKTNRMANSIIRIDPYSKKNNQILQRTQRERSCQSFKDQIYDENLNKNAKIKREIQIGSDGILKTNQEDDAKHLTQKHLLNASKMWREGVIMRSRSHSRGPYELSASKSTKKAHEDVVKARQDAFLANRSKTSLNLIEHTSGPTRLASWRSFSRLTHGSTTALNARLRAKTPQRMPLSDDATAILEIYDPVKNDRRREHLRRKALLTANDSIGFNIIQQELESFRQLKELALGRTRCVKIADLPAVERLNAAEILKKYKLYLQRPKNKPLHEYYNDDDAELEGRLFLKV